MSIPRILPIVAVVITFFSCWSPIYDERISASAKLSLKLDSLAIKSTAIGPVDWSMGNSDSDYEYLPSRYNDLDTGILVAKGGDNNISIRFFGQQDAATPAIIGGYGLSGAEGFSARTVLISTAVTERYAARPLLFGLNGTATRSRDFRSCYRDPIYAPASSELTESTTSISFSGIPTMSYLVAAGAVLDVNGVADDVEFLYLDSNSTTYSRVGAVYDYPNATYPDGNSTVQVQGVGMTINKGSRFFRLNNDFYLCAYSSSTGTESIHCFRWVDSGVGSVSTLAAQPVALTSITAPIVGILSQEGVILAQDSLFLYAFTKDGAELFSVPSGSIHFMQEFSVDGQLCAIFTQVIVTKLNYQNKYVAKTWAVRSDAIRSIAN